MGELCLKKLEDSSALPHLKCKLATKITAQKMKCSIKDFFSKCNQMRRKLRIWSNLLKKSLMENFIFCALNCNLKLLAFQKLITFLHLVELVM